MRNEQTPQKPQMLPISKIHDLPGDPFPAPKNDEIAELIQSVRGDGIKQPIIVRQREDGEYEVISGKRRLQACELLQMQTIPAFVCETTLEEAVKYRAKCDALPLSEKEDRSMTTDSKTADATHPCTGKTILERISEIAHKLKTKKKTYKKPHYRK